MKEKYQIGSEQHSILTSLHPTTISGKLLLTTPILYKAAYGTTLSTSTTGSKDGL